MLTNDPFCKFGKYKDTCCYLAAGYDGNTCPLNTPFGTYCTVPFTNNYWGTYALPQYANYISNNDVKFFVDDTSMQRALPIYDYASQSLVHIESLQKNIEETQFLLQNFQTHRKIEVINSYAQRNIRLIPNRNFGLSLTDEQVKFIWKVGSELLSDPIKESIKATDTYKTSGDLSKRVQLFAVDVGKEVVDKVVEDIIDGKRNPPIYR